MQRTVDRKEQHEHLQRRDLGRTLAGDHPATTTFGDGFFTHCKRTLTTSTLSDMMSFIFAFTGLKINPPAAANYVSIRNAKHKLSAHGHSNVPSPVMSTSPLSGVKMFFIRFTSSANDVGSWYSYTNRSDKFPSLWI